jgi:tetratricopeptide (TPR) repeat protein
VQLIDALKDKHIWTESYEKEIKEVRDIFSIQSQIAQSIAEELKTVITPEEKKLIEKIPTTNLTAYDFYWRGREEHLKYWNNLINRDALQKAEDLYHYTLQYDSTYALAYTGLAWVYWDKHYFKDYLSESFLDSVPILCDIALSFNHQLSEAHTLKGMYCNQTGKWEQALEEFDKAIEFNPNDWMAYRGKGEFYYETDWINFIKYYQKAASINRGPELPELLSKLGYAYASAGFHEKAEKYYQDKLKLDSDSVGYYSELARIEFWFGNFNKSMDLSVKGVAVDSTNLVALTFLADNYGRLNRNAESLKYREKYVKIFKTQGDKQVMHFMHRIGYAFWQNGYKEAAEYYFNEQIKYCEKSIALGRQYEQMLHTYYDLAGVYAFKGERDKAYENLRIFNKKPMMSSWMVSLIKTDPLFNSIRNEPEFQLIVRDVEVKYQAEHESVRKWLEEQGML